VGGQGRGVAHYTSALLGAMAAGFPGEEWRAVLPRGGADALPAGVSAVRSRVPGRLLHGSAAFAGRPRLDRLAGGADVVWAPSPAPLARSRDVPFVLTVHDLSWELRPGDFTAYERAWHRVARPRALAAGAALVMVDAEATRTLLADRWDVDPGSVRVVRPGVERPAAPVPAAEVAAVLARHGLGGRYLLFVGALEPRKGVDVLARAFAAARRAGLDAELAIAGEGRLGGELEGSGVRRLGRVGGGDLGALYAGALALVLPSHLEGFGFTPLEAAAHGTPAVASDLPVLRESLGDEGAVWVAPGDEAGLADALARIAGDEDLRDRVGATAARALDGLTWPRAAAAAHAVLAEAARR
jgi:glycosyltransferase involved in cell wall biosynthesis